MIVRGNHKSSNTNLNAAALENLMGKEVEHVLDLPLTIDSVHHINTEVVTLLGLSG